MLQEVFTFFFCVAALAAVLASFPGLTGPVASGSRGRERKKSSSAGL